MNPGLVVKLRPAGPWRIGPDSGARNRVDAIYHSDSLYSAVTSAMSRMGSLDAWLDATARSQTPAVCFSSCFPFLDDIGFVVPPRTIWPPTSPQAMSARVRWKSARFIPLSVVESILSGKKLNDNQWSVDGASGCLVPAGKPGPFRTSVRWNAAVDRLSGSSERHATACIEFREGCGLWTVAGFHDEAARDQWQEPVKAAFRLLADTGFGGERSRGWGRSETPEFVEGTLPGLIVEYKRKEPRAEAAEPETKTSAPGPEPTSASVSASEGAAPDLVPVASPSLEGESVAPEALAGATPEGGAAPIRAATVRERSAAAPETEAAAPETEPAAVAPEAEAAAPAAVAETGLPVVAQAVPPADFAAPETVPAAVAPQTELAPEIDDDSLKPAPTLQETGLPVVAQAGYPLGPPANIAATEAAPTAELAPEATAPEVAPVTEAAPEAAAPETESAAEVAPEAEGAPIGDATVGSREEIRPQAGVGKLKHAPPLQENGLPVMAQALPPANLAEPETEPAPAPAPTEAAVRAPDRTEPMRVAPEREAPPTPSVRLQAHWLLSLFAPAADDAIDWGRGSYAVLARGGRIDSPSGSGELKKQIQMVSEGSVLVSEGVPLGAAPDVAPDGFAHPVFRAGFALAIPLPEVH